MKSMIRALSLFGLFLVGGLFWSAPAAAQLNSSKHTFYVDANNHVDQVYTAAGIGSAWLDVTAATHATNTAASGTALTGFDDSVGEHAFYLGTNQHVYQLNWTSTGGWSNQDLTAITGNTLAAAGTKLTSFSSSNGEHVYYLGPNQHVYELYWNSGTHTWSNGDLTANHGNVLASTGSSLTSFSDSSGQSVFYIGTNQHVYQFYWNSVNGWSNGDLTANHGNILVGTGSKLTSFSNSNGEHVYYLGTNQHVYELYWNSTNGWSNGDLTASTGNTLAAAGSSLTSFSDSTGQHVLYLGTNQHVYQLYHSTSWSNQDITLASSAANTAAAGSSLSSIGIAAQVYYTGTSHDLYALSFSSGSGWLNTDVTVALAAPAPASGSALASFQ